MDHIRHLAVDVDAVGFGQRIGRALDVAGVAGGVQQGAGEGGFAGAQVAMQVDRHAGKDGARQRRAKGGGAGFIVQVGCEVLHQLKCLYV